MNPKLSVFPSSLSKIWPWTGIARPRFLMTCFSLFLSLFLFSILMLSPHKSEVLLKEEGDRTGSISKAGLYLGLDCEL